MIKRIISGGQIGADIAGLRAAKRLNLKTGGWMPQEFKTLHGKKPEYEELYGMETTDTPFYPARTFLNVSDSDCTVRFATNFNSPGEMCTFRAIRKYNKPYMDFKLVHVNREIELPSFWEMVPVFRDWCKPYKILNVTGNANTGIEQIVEDFLVEALKK